MTRLTDTMAKLEELWVRREELAQLVADKERLIDSAIPEEVRKKVAEIEQEFAPALEAAQARISALESEVKAQVIQLGESVKGKHLHAVLARRTAWDTKGLEGYAVAHPEVLTFRREEPYVSIKAVK